jgi:hypothetical protein
LCTLLYQKMTEFKVVLFCKAGPRLRPGTKRVW